jgi:hypothetical protein
MQNEESRMTGSAEQAPADDLVAANLCAVRARMVAAAEAVGRDPAKVTLVAVSKAQAGARMQAALAAGQRVFGENYLQEAKARWPALRAPYPDLRLHMIGPIQTNKARDAVALFDEIARRNGLDQLSMGMSADYEIAVQFGATHVRGGRALFGARPPRAGSTA